MTYQWVDHTAELELRIDAAAQEEVFADALAAFAELVATSGAGETVEVPLHVEGADRAAQLVGWLEELVYLADVESIEPERAERVELGEGRVDAVIRGHIGAPRPLVKAVTYHRAEFEPEDGAWRARVVLDV